MPLIRARVTFAQLNLVEDVYPSFLNHTTGLDLILCRNVLIYFREETTRRVVARLYDALRDGGWLIVGHAEPSQAVFHQFHTHNFPGATIYQKNPEAVHSFPFSGLAPRPPVESIQPGLIQGQVETIVISRVPSRAA